MQVATRLIFHDVARSDWVESYVAERLAKLDRLAGGIISCRLTLTREQSSRHQGNLYSVLIEVRLPPHRDLTAKKQNNIKDMATELPALMTQAFAAIESQLKKAAERRRYDGKVQQGESHAMAEARFNPEEGEKGPQARDEAESHNRGLRSGDAA